MPTRFNTPVSPRGDAPLARMLRHIPPYVALILLAFITGLVTGTAAFILKTTVRWVSHPIASHLAAGHANWLLLTMPLLGHLLKKAHGPCGKFPIFLLSLHPIYPNIQHVKRR